MSPVSTVFILQFLKIAIIGYDFLGAQHAIATALRILWVADDKALRNNEI
jgi:hypothetical protein